MARQAGRSARLWVGPTNGAAAAPVTSTKGWSVNSDRDELDATCQGDNSKVVLLGLPGGTGSFNAIYATGETSAAFTASVDGLSRKVYGYLSAALDAYFYCTANFSAGAQTEVGGLVELNGTFAADTPIYWVGV